MKVIYPTENTRIPKALREAVKDAYEKRKESEPELRMIDVWFELVKKVKK